MNEANYANEKYGLGISKARKLLVVSCGTCGIAGCVTHLYVQFSWHLLVLQLKINSETFRLDLRLFFYETLRLLMLLMIPALYGFGQYNKYIIRFIDKYNSPYSLSNPSAYLSQKAIDRRTRYSIAFDSSDLPVNPSYVQQVLLHRAR